MSDSPSSERPWRWIGGLGIVYSVLYLIGALLLTGSSPSDTASPAKVATYYADHKAALTGAVFTIAVAMVVFGFFLSSLRRVLSRSGRDGGYLSITIVIGGAVYIGGFLLSSLLQLALVEAGKNHADSVAQTLNYLSTYQWAPIVVGLSMTALGIGISGLRTRTLPSWLSWTSIAFGVLALAGPLGGIAYLLTPLWTLALAIVLVRPSARVVPTTISDRTPAPVAG
jgi:hypothetical protein